MKILFMGTPDFALPSLEKLNEYHDVKAVFTQPDKKVGRKQILTPPDVKVLAEKLSIPVFQPSTLKNDDAYNLLKEINPELIVVAAYGKILPLSFIDYPKYGCINVHASLLPKYRGAAPIQASVLNGDEKTGVTIMKMAEGLDTGDILTQRETEIGIDDTSESMFEKLSVMGADLLIETISLLENGEVSPIKQDDSLSSYASMIDKTMSVIDFEKSAFEVHKKICGLYSWPIAQTMLNGNVLKIYKSKINEKSGDPGTILSLEPFIVACKDKSIEILELQLSGKKRMDAHSFILGHHLSVGDKLGED